MAQANSYGEEELLELCKKFRKGMDIQDRKYHGKVYPQCFIGEQAVTWLTQNTRVKDRKDAVELGQKIMNKKVFSHVLNQHSFKDKELYYNLLPDTTPKTLYERLGGLRGVSSVVDDFIDRLKGNNIILSNPAVREAFGRVLLPGLKYQISEMICSVIGGPQTYTGRNMRDSHSGLKITESEWNSFVIDFKASLDKFKVPSTEQNELFAIVGSVKGEIVTGDTLYERLGGIKSISTVVSAFLDRVAVNQVILANPSVKQAFGMYSIPALKYLVTEMVAQAAGGPQKYSGKSMKESHKHLGITEQEWGAFAATFKETLDGFKVPVREQNELFVIVGSLKADIVQSAPSGPRSLYDRLGGVAVIATVVDDFIDKVRTDYVINSNPIVKELNLRGLPSGFKNLVTEIVAMACGGPQKYTGESMKESHKGMNITEREWQQFVALFKATLDKFKVPMQEQNELCGIVGSLKNDIVAPGR